MDTQIWENWAGSLRAYPCSYLQPISVSQLQDIIVNNPQRKIRAVGTGHSWSPLVVTQDILLSAVGITEAGKKAWRWQKNGLNLVTYLPSATWADVRDALIDPQNPAPRMYLPTAGVLPSINATGFVAAGCHGTGWQQPTVSDLIYAIEIVGSDGQIHTFSEETTPDEMPIVRVSLGTLGIISRVTLKVEPLYCLEDTESVVPTSAIMGPNPESGAPMDASALSALITGNDYIELFWFPWSGADGSQSLSDGFIWVKQFNRTNLPPGPPPPYPPDWQVWFAKQLMEQVAEYPVNSTAALVPPIESLVWENLNSSIQANGTFVAEAPDVLHYQRDAFPVMDLEIAIPIPAIGTDAWDFTNIVQAWYQVVNYTRNNYPQAVYPLTCCMHARFIKNSQSLLSPAYEPEGSSTHYCWIEVLSAYPRTETNPNNRRTDNALYQGLVNAIGPAWTLTMKGRPHWAKCWQDIPNIDIASLYPSANLEKFNQLRAKMDPNGMFLNPFLQRLGLFT